MSAHTVLQAVAVAQEAPAAPPPQEPTSSIVMLLICTSAMASAAVVAWRRRNRLVSLGCGAIALLIGWEVARALPTYVWVIVAVAMAAGGGLAWHRRSRTASTVTRWGERSRRKSGVASTTDIARTAGRKAIRKQASTVRPSLAELSHRERLRVATTEVGIPLCRVGAQRLWASVEDVVCVFGGPRTGKTGWLAGRVIDAPGAAIVTSTRTDLHTLTAELRAQRGPVRVFNAVGLGGLASTATFDPLTGCTNPVTAAERATDLLAAGSTARGGEREYWEAQARRNLAALLHAAALGGQTMQDVLRWVADPDQYRNRITALLERSSEPAYGDDAIQFLSTNDRTRTSITSTIMPALGWLTSPAASAAASSAAPIDVAEMLRTRTTVYLLGAEETQAAPLVCALTGHIAREARRIAAEQVSGRLDPPLTLALDEAALISPVPLDSWTADMGGRGVTIIAAFQSRAQLVARWGDTGAAIILNNTAAVMLFGGTRDRDDLSYWASLAGERDETVETRGKDGAVTSRTVRKTPVLAPSQMANLPSGKVVVFRRGMPPVVGRVQMAWHRRDVKAQTARTRKAHEAVVAAAEVATRATPARPSAPPPIPSPARAGDTHAGETGRVPDGR